VIDYLKRRGGKKNERKMKREKTKEKTKDETMKRQRKKNEGTQHYFWLSKKREWIGVCSATCINRRKRQAKAYISTFVGTGCAGIPLSRPFLDMDARLHHAGVSATSTHLNRESKAAVSRTFPPLLLDTAISTITEGIKLRRGN
jgi:hypothetical protein